MKVSLIARTRFNDELAEDLTGFVADTLGTDAGNLAEFAGRACYDSFNKPNPATRDNADYLAHIFEIEHESVVEHGTCSFYIEGVSRALTHELVRHRHHSYSQLSQRFVKLGPGVTYVTPPLFEDNDEAAYVLQQAWEMACNSYEALVMIGERTITQRSLEPTKARKRVREAARAVLPNMTPTAIVVSGNHRSWREFLISRGSLSADAEIRRLAVTIYLWLSEVEPNLYQDMHVAKDEDGEQYVGLVV